MVIKNKGKKKKKKKEISQGKRKTEPESMRQVL